MKQSFLKTLQIYFRLFYSYVGRRLYFLCFVIFLSGLFEGLGISLLLPLLNVGQPLAEQDTYSQKIYAFFQQWHIEPSLYLMLFLLFIAVLLKQLFFLWQGIISADITTGLTKRLRIQFCQKYADMTYRHYVGSSIGYLNNVVTTEVERGIFGFSKFVDMIVVAAYILVYFAATLLINWTMALFAFLVFFLLVVPLRSLSTQAQTFSRKVSQKNAQIQSLLLQIIYYFKYLKATNRFGKLNGQLKGQIEELRQYQFKETILRFIPPAILEPSAVIFLSLLIIYQVVYRGHPMSEVLILILFFYKSFQRLFGLRAEWQKFSSYVGGIDVLRKTEKELEQNKEEVSGKVLEKFDSAIELKNVNFRYDSKPVLFDISLKIPKNKSIGIVGESGSGKTTIFDILAGLVKAQGGEVLMDGVSYGAIDLRSLRNMLGYVTQEPVIFNDTIANNISFWAHEDSMGTRQSIERCARLAHCEEFIKNTENGYETILGDKGVRLSVGQRQRVAIAREHFKNPEIMIFDEATSALDSESERLIQESIDSLTGNKTMVIVAHRLSTIKKCDYIYVLHQGRIVEHGSFHDLQARRDSRFARMCTAQNLAIEN